MRSIVKGFGIAAMAAVLGIILPQPMAVLMCGPLYKYCGWICC